MTSKPQMPAHSTLWLCSGQAPSASSGQAFSLRAGSAQEQASLFSFIPNQPLSRQGKSLEAISKIFLPLALSLFALRAYPNNPLYPQGKPDACVVGEKTFSTWRKPLLASIFGLPPWPRIFRSAS